MKIRVWLAASIVFGAAAVLLTGLLDVTPAGLVGATWYGYPLPWLRRLVIAPQYYPWRVDSVNLILDVGAWLAVAIAAAWSTVKVASHAAPAGLRRS